MKVNKESIRSLLIISPILLIITFFNSYIFNDDYLIFFTSFLLLYLATKPFFKLDKRLVINLNIFYFLALLIYFIFRFDESNMLDLRSGTDLLNIGLYFLVFMLGGIISYNKKSISTLLWLGASLYILMVIVRSLFSLAELQQGYNLSTAIVILMIIPFALASPEKYRSTVFNISFFILIIFFALIGARGAILSLVGMFFFIKYHYFFSRTKVFYALTFVLLLLSVAFFIFLYLMLAHDEQIALGSSDSVFNILQKRVGTRLDIWIHTLYFIAIEPFVGHGTNMSTSLQEPSTELSFSMNRNNIATHSTYFEILYRSGVLGLSLYLIFWYQLWMSFYKYQYIYEIKIASGMIISILILSMTSTVMIFNVLELWTSFAWYYFGFSYGKIIKLSRHERQGNSKVYIKQVR